MLGGRTNHWGRISLRFGPDDFRRKSLDGLGDDWPITYDDLKPYYDKVDDFVGIFGSNGEGLPNEPDGIFQPPPKPRCYELLIKQAADKLNIPCIAVAAVDPHAAAQRPAGVPLLRPVRPRLRDALELLVAVGAAAAGDGDRQARRSSPTPWRARSRSTTSGLATGVSYIDKTTGRENHVRARIVVLAASACESARLLLNSKSSQLPAGPGQLQRRRRQVPDRHDRRRASRGFIPKLMDGVPHNEDGAGGMHLYMPWWLDNKKLDFPRGYHIELGGGRRHARLRVRAAASTTRGIDGTASRSAATARRSRTTIAVLRRDGRASPAAAR